MLATEWEPQNSLEVIALYAVGAYPIVIMTAFALWMWARHVAPKQPPSTERGKRLHARLHQQVKAGRNRMLLVLIPLAVLILVPGLPALHILAAAAVLIVLAGVAFLVFRDAYRFIARQT